MAELLGAVVGRAPRPPLPWGAAPTSAVKWGIPIPANGVAPAHPTAAVVASRRPRTRHGRTKRTRGRAFPAVPPRRQHPSPAAVGHHGLASILSRPAEPPAAVGGRPCHLHGRACRARARRERSVPAITLTPCARVPASRSHPLRSRGDLAATAGSPSGRLPLPSSPSLRRPPRRRHPSSSPRIDQGGDP